MATYLFLKHGNAGFVKLLSGIDAASSKEKKLKMTQVNIHAMQKQNIPNVQSGDYCNVLLSLMGSYFRHWKIVQFLGGGSFGVVFLMHDGRDFRAVKMATGDVINDTKTEMRAQSQFAKHGLSVDIHGVVQINKQISAIIMDRVAYTLKTMICIVRGNESRIRELANNVVILLRELYKWKLTHGDFNIGNIAFIPDGDKGGYKPVLIDFGWASTDTDRVTVEIEQLVRDLSEFFHFEDTWIFVEEIEKFLVEIGSDYVIQGGHYWRDALAPQLHKIMEVLTDKERQRIVDTLNSVYRRCERQYEKKRLFLKRQMPPPRRQGVDMEMD